MSIKFISYDGQWPTLCHGTITFLHNDVKKTIEDALTSTGRTYFTAHYTKAHTEKGEWKWTDEPSHYGLTQEEADDLIRQINANVEHGCCGGCL